MCVANKVTKSGHQLTVLWHVDDLKISCKNKVEVTKLICYLRGIYGDKMTIKRGGKGKYLGMNLDFTEPGVLQVDMSHYVKEILDGFCEEVTKTSATPHSDNLFTIKADDEAVYLPEEQAMQFHQTTAQLLFLSTRARKDIQTAVSFLTTRVKKRDEDDWKKIRKVLEYLNGTIDLKLRVEVKDLRVMRWYVDTAHMVHWDCKGQTGAAMTMGRGAVLSYSWKQKVNTKSSTKTELVGVDDAISNILWSLYFLQEQGCWTGHAIIYHDNKSVILLESNGKFSSGKRTKHIKAKYFFVTDKVADGDVVIKHTPTETMWADMNTKPKQGRAFCIDRSYMMNCPEELDQDNFAQDGRKVMGVSTGEDYGDDGHTDGSTPTQKTHVPHVTNEKRVSWESSQECVGSGRKLGGRRTWDVLTSALGKASRRLV
eukprot:CCRYP_014199-RC/>CCRYP_014199-RC protein AED:0.39 eAED:0.39 QI:0/-1/0/1/-1/1/1/0/426